jgi:hypothetical protein
MERNHGFIKVAPDKKEIQDLTEKAVKNYVSEDSQREGFSISTEESFGDLENQAIAKYLNLRDGETVEEIILQAEQEIALLGAKLRLGGDFLSGTQIKELKYELKQIEENQKTASKHLIDNPEDQEATILLSQLKFFKERKEKIQMLLDSDIQMITPEEQDKIIEAINLYKDEIDILKRYQENQKSNLN